MTDMLVSLCQYTLSGERIRPMFGPGLCIRRGYHPILEHRDRGSTIANDTDLSNHMQFVLLSGREYIDIAT